MHKMSNLLLKILILCLKQRTSGYFQNECRCPELSWLDSQDSAKRNSPVFPFKVMGTEPWSLLYLMPPFMQHKEKEHKHLLP